MKFSITTLGTNGVISPEDLMPKLSQWGYDGIELWLVSALQLCEVERAGRFDRERGSDEPGQHLRDRRVGHEHGIEDKIIEERSGGGVIPDHLELKARNRRVAKRLEPNGDVQGGDHKGDA